MNTPKPDRANGPASYLRTAKLPPTFKVSLAGGRSISVVRRDIMASALGRQPKK